MKSVTAYFAASAVACGVYLAAALPKGPSPLPPLNAQYEAQSSSAKQQQVWAKCTANTTPNTYYGALDQLSLFAYNMDVSFDWVSDEIKPGRKKLIHSVAPVALAQWKAVDNEYTGLFQGADHGIIRFGHITPADTGKHTCAPALSIKFFRDGVPSGNLLTAYILDGQKTLKMMANPMSNWVPVPESLPIKAVAKKFSQASPHPTKIGLRNFAEYAQDGSAPAKIKVPYKLVLQPGEQVSSMYPEDTKAPFVEQLKAIPAGSLMWTAYAYRGPNDVEPIKIGELYITTQFTTSAYADSTLFFRHTRIEDDWELEPSWTMPADKIF
ncbi:hypothetical protein HK102_007490 [Quaeritorhiza haematococci]|nr:hypothetical protein HK102_007490 [Quaeritorhiza haematococci]